MSCQPATLSCFAVFNSTLTAAELDIRGDRDDAEQQAQILFYTSKETAVSKDKMLRQVGLAQALITFSGNLSGSMHEQQEIHSQTSRMVLASPEPDFWIYACIDAPRTPKGKDRSDTGKGKAKASDSSGNAQSFEYHDAFLKDPAIQAHLMRGYEEFKLLHGPFSMILNESGRQVLENSLERFFAPWVWQWNVDRMSSQFGSQSAQIRRHPYCDNLLPIINSAEITSPSIDSYFILESEYILQPEAPEASSLRPAYPHSLPLFFLRSISPSRRKDPDTTKAKGTLLKKKAHSKDETLSPPPHAKSKGSLRMPSLNTMNPRKWNLGSYLAMPAGWTSLAASGTVSPEVKSSTPPRDTTDEKKNLQEGATEPNGRRSHDEDSTGDNDTTLSSSQATILAVKLREAQNMEVDDSTLRHFSMSAPEDALSEQPVSTTASETSSLSEAIVEEELPFRSLDIYLPTQLKGSSEVVMRRKLRYTQKDQMLFAAIMAIDAEDFIPNSLPHEVSILFTRLSDSLDGHKRISIGAEHSTDSKWLTSDEQLSTSNQSLSAFSDSLFDSWHMLHYPEVVEVISRPLTTSRPWTGSKRRPGSGDGPEGEASAHVEMSRPDATLIDVDRELSTVYSRTFGQVV